MLMKECCKYFLQPQDDVRRHFSFGNGYLSHRSSPAGSCWYSDTLLPLNSYLYVLYYTGSSDFVNTICAIFENFMKFFLKTFHNRRR